jgi:glycosyltransferase involved in cell wall biosynthesis
MHIIALASYPSSFRGGQELSLLEVCRSLHHRGHQISLLYLNEGDLLPQYREFCSDVMGIHSYKVLRKKELFYFLSDLWRIPHSKESIVYSNQYHDCVMGYALKELRNIPLICHLRTPAPKDDLASDWQLRISLKGVNRFISVSHQTQLDWVKWGVDPSRIEVVHNGSNLNRFKPTEDISRIRQEWNIPTTAKVVSYVGRLDGVKGVETLIQAIALLPLESVNVRLLIAGQPVGQGDTKERDTYLRSLHNLPIALGIEDRVQFLGHVFDTLSLYQLSDVTVLPSLYNEPFARAVIESMACGTPVVGSRIGGTLEVLTGEFERLLFEPGNPQELATLLNTVLNWRTTEPDLGTRCHQHIMSGFTIEHTVGQIEQIMLDTRASSRSRKRLSQDDPRLN